MRIKQIKHIARKIGLGGGEYELYGDYKAKINLKVLNRLESKPPGHLIFITSITPTPTGEGKTTTSIGLLDALSSLRKKAILCLREPSLGPVFGIKGGATGGGKARLYPSDEINLHFTGDAYAVTTAHNLLAAMIDNHIYWGNKLKLDPKSICWGRTTEISDRALREIQVGLNIKREGYPRNSTFCISSASEIMAILSLFKDPEELRRMLSRIIIGYSKDGYPVYSRQLKVVDSMLLLLKDAIKPNLVQTIEGNPVLVHTGPFANVAHGNSSLIATHIALRLSDYVITEGGFGADLGFEKFVHIVCRKAGFKISAVVVVVSIKALKYHGGKELSDLRHKDIKAIEKGLGNLERHISNIRKFGFEPVLCINVFPQDKREEIEYLKKHCKEKLRLKVATSEAYKRGSSGAMELAEAVLEQIEESKPKIKYLYPLNASIEDKILKIAIQVYGAEGVQYSEEAIEKLKKFREFGLGGLPINIARTQFSFTHDPKLRGAPSGWRLKVRDLCILNGAGFVVPVTGKLMLLPALPKVSLAERVKYKKGKFIGLD